MVQELNVISCFVFKSRSGASACLYALIRYKSAGVRSTLEEAGVRVLFCSVLVFLGLNCCLPVWPTFPMCLIDPIQPYLVN